MGRKVGALQLRGGFTGKTPIFIRRTPKSTGLCENQILERDEIFYGNLGFMGFNRCEGWPPRMLSPIHFGITRQGSKIMPLGATHQPKQLLHFALDLLF